MNKETIFRASRQVRPLEAVLADESSWKGTMPELLESVARDENQPLDVRLACTNALLRQAGGGAPERTKPNYREYLDRMTNREKRIWLHLTEKVHGHPPRVEHNHEMAACLDWLAEESESERRNRLSFSDAPPPRATADAAPTPEPATPPPAPPAKPRRRAAKAAEAPAAAEVPADEPTAEPPRAGGPPSPKAGRRTGRSA